MLKRSLRLIFAAWMAAAMVDNAAEQPAPPTVVIADAAANSAAASPQKQLNSQLSPPEPIDTDPVGTVRLLGVTTDIGTRYSFLAPPIPFPPFNRWHRWLKEHRSSVHCALEWKDTAGQWQYAEMRSTKWDGGSTDHRVGLGQFPCTGYIAYGVFIFPGRFPRIVDQIGRPVDVQLDELVKCDYRQLEYEIRKYGAYGKKPGDPGTGGYGKENCGLGGPGYKPGQNSNTMINFVLCKCGIHREAPARAIGWDTRPTFPYSTDTRFPKYDNQP